MARVINRTTPEIVVNNRHSGLDFISIDEKGFYFPKQISFSIKAATNKYIHFINDDDYWAFYVNEDKDGFPFSMDKQSYRVNDRALSRLFLRTTNRECGDRLLVKYTKAKHNGGYLYEIHTKESVEQITTLELDVLKKKRPYENRKRITESI